MTKLIAAAFASVLAISAQAMPLAPPHSDDTVTLVREACGAGMHRVNGARSPHCWSRCCQVRPRSDLLGTAQSLTPPSSAHERWSKKVANAVKETRTSNLDERLSEGATGHYP